MKEVPRAPLRKSFKKPMRVPCLSFSYGVGFGFGFKVLVEVEGFWVYGCMTHNKDESINSRAAWVVAALVPSTVPTMHRL